MPKKNWTQEDLQKAIAEVRHGKTIKGSARKYGMSEAMIRFRTMYRIGFSPTNEQIKDIVKEYLQL